MRAVFSCFLAVSIVSALKMKVSREVDAEQDQIGSSGVNGPQEDFGFMSGGDLPEICGVKTLTSGQDDYLKGLHTAFRHAGVRKHLSTVFVNGFKCWYGKMLYKDGCGDLKPQRTTSADRRKMQEKCRDPKIGYKALFADPAVTEAERQYVIKNYPTRRDLEGEPIEGEYSEVMNVLYKLGGKEVLCQTLELIDDGCKEVGPFKEY